MSSEPIISVCIPTYNFGSFISQTLESIVGQCSDDIEVIVVDGASTDDTPSIVNSFQERYSNVRYYRLDHRGGIDRDMARAVDFARGQYCWLFSSDDVMHEGAIDFMREEVKSAHDLYLCKHTNCSLQMHFLNEHPVLIRDIESSFNIENRERRLAYFRLAANTEAFFSFMGGLIVNRNIWNSVSINERFIGSCWAHVARIFDVMTDKLSIKYIPYCLLDRRGENDSFAACGVVNRLRLAIEGYSLLADHFFGSQSEEAHHIRRALRNEFGLRQVMYAKLLCQQEPALENRTTLDKLVTALYRDRNLGCLLNGAAYRIVPASAYSLLRSLYRAWRPLVTHDHSTLV